MLAIAFSAPAAGASEAGGAAPPEGDGGARYGESGEPAPKKRPPARERTPERPRERGTDREERPRKRANRRGGGPVLASFDLARPRLFLYGRPARVSFRVDGRGRSVNVRLALVRTGGGRAATIKLGERATGVTHSLFLTGREAGILPQGSYVLRISARDRRGRGLRRSAQASAAQELSFLHHRFPLTGTFAYGGADARFGASRSGHRHQGQDLTAAEGTPIVAPRGGVVETVQYQAGGAGHYVVVDGEGEDRDYAFMHLRAGSTRVAVGQRVRTGQRLGDVGSTGASSGPHLHFEVWVGGWFAKGGAPIDPHPLLRAWDSWS